MNCVILTRSTVTLVTKGDIEKLATLSGVHDFVQKDGKATFLLTMKR